MPLFSIWLHPSGMIFTHFRVLCLKQKMNINKAQKLTVKRLRASMEVFRSAWSFALYSCSWELYFCACRWTSAVLAACKRSQASRNYPPSLDISAQLAKHLLEGFTF